MLPHSPPARGDLHRAPLAERVAAAWDALEHDLAPLARQAVIGSV